MVLARTTYIPPAPPLPFSHNAQHARTHAYTHAFIQFGNARPRGVLVWQWPCRRPAPRKSNLRLVTTPCVQEETRLLAPTISKTVRIGYKGPSSVLYDCTLSVKLLEDRSTATLYPPSLPTVRHEDYIFGTYFKDFTVSQFLITHVHRSAFFRSASFDRGRVDSCRIGVLSEFIHGVLRVGKE